MSFWNIAYILDVFVVSCVYVRFLHHFHQYFILAIIVKYSETRGWDVTVVIQSGASVFRCLMSWLQNWEIYLCIQEAETNRASGNSKVTAGTHVFFLSFFFFNYSIDFVSEREVGGGSVSDHVTPSPVKVRDWLERLASPTMWAKSRDWK